MSFLNKKRTESDNSDDKNQIKGHATKNEDNDDNKEKEKFKFIAKIKMGKKNSRNSTKIIKPVKITGRDLVFKYRKEKAREIMNNIKNENIELNETQEKLKESLHFDNTNKDLIFERLCLLYKLKNKKKFSNLLPVQDFALLIN